MRKKLGALILMFIVLGCFLLQDSLLKDKKEYIDIVLKKPAYSYLPIEAKDYIKEIYGQTGNILLSEKNKKRNKPYLNPLYVEYLTFNDAKKNELELIPSPTVTDYNSQTVEKDEKPSKYDLRNVAGKNYVTPVRNQGNLGNCWTFASAGSVESYLLKTNNKSYDEKSLLISERQIDYATSIDGFNDYNSEYVSFVKRKLGSGGNYYISTIAMANGISLFNYNNFKKYNDADLSTMEMSDVLNYAKSEYEVNSTNMISTPGFRLSTDKLTEEQKAERNNYINEVKAGIMKYGAAYVSTSVGGGCYYKDTNLNNMVIDVYNCDRLSGGHAMQIIGWDDDIEYSYCANSYNNRNTPVSSCKKDYIVKGKGAWILKNSWGKDDPYPYLAYDSLYTSVAFVTDLSKTLAGRNMGDTSGEWKYNYILGSELEDISSTELSLKPTKIKGDKELESEELRKIKFISLTYDTTFDIEITDDQGKISKISKTIEMPGLVTIEVPFNIYINEKSTIKITTKDGSFIDKVMLFTARCYSKPFVSYKKYDNQISTPKIRLYQEYKLVESNTAMEYKLYDSNNNDVTDKITYTNNVVGENNANPLFDFSSLSSGKYKLDTIYKGEVINTDEIEYLKMDGTGTEDDPYVIMTPFHLDQIREDLDAYYVLGADIDMTEVTRAGGLLSYEAQNSIGNHGWRPIDKFSGTLDGKGHTIKGLYQKTYIKKDNSSSYMTDSSNARGGLFDRLDGNVTIKNLNIDNFDISFISQGGILFAKYETQNKYNVNIENIVIKNSTITGQSGGSALFTSIVTKGNINISNVYIEANVNIEQKTGYDNEFLADIISGRKVNINNVQMLGNLNSIRKKYAYFYVLREIDCSESNISNIFSNVNKNYDDNVEQNYFIKRIGYGFDTNYSGSLNLKNVYVINNGETELLHDNDFEKYENTSSNIKNVKMYQRDIDTNKLLNDNQYENWEDFDKYWTIKTVDNIKRYPMLKIANAEYTKIDGINIKQELNRKYNIYNYISPSVSIKDAIFKSNDESIVKIDEDGRIIPISSGTTTIHVESFYDGYIKDVPITIEYKPHYIIKFNKNSDASGEMEDVEVDITDDYIVENKFDRKYYDFTGWSTSQDGSKNEYKDGVVTKQKDKTVITLYAQWRGKKSVITIDPAGGTVNPTSIDVYYGEYIGQVSIPTREGYGFNAYRFSDAPDVVWTIQGLSNQKAGYYENGRTLVAGWKENAYTIIYHPNGVSSIDYTSLGVNSKDSKLEKNIYIREGYTFKEWNTKADGTGDSYGDRATINLNNVPNSVLNLYAIWQKNNIEVIFDAAGGIGTMDKQLIPYGEKTVLNKNVFTKTGYTFKEWNTKADGTGTSYKDGEKITITDDITLYAIWEENFSYKIDGYEQDDENKYIGSIKAGTTLDAFTSHIKLNDNYTLKVDTKRVNDKELLYTGGKTRIYKNNELYAEYTNVVIGDVNGNATIDIIDYIRIMKDIMETQKLSGPYLKAADVNQNGSIDIIDYIRIMKMIMEEKQ